MDSQNNTLAVLFDLSQAISSETSLMPLLTKVLEHLMFHTNSKCGIILNSTQMTDDSISYQIRLTEGDANIVEHIDEFVSTNVSASSDTTFDLSLLPIKQNYYQSQLIIPIDDYGMILLLREESDNYDKELFQPLISNLSKAVLLCQNNDAYSSSLSGVNELEIKDLEKIAAGLSIKSGKDFFQSVALHLGEVLDSEYTFICLTNPEDPKFMDSIAMSVNGQIVDSFTYELAGTPCEHVIKSENKEITSFPSNLKTLFPSDKYLVKNDVQSYIGTPLLNERNEIIGLIAVMNKWPMEKTRRIENVLSIFSIRVSNEIERLQRLDEMQQVSNVLENSPFLVFRWRAVEGWPVEFVSNNVHQLGYTPEEFISGKRRYASIIHPDDLLRVEREVRDFSASGVKDFTQEYRVVTADGNVIWTFDRTSIEKDDDGNITYYQGTVIDITDRKQMEDELRLSEQHLKLYSEQAPLATIEWDVDFQVKSWNTAAEKLFGYPLEEVKGRNFIDIMLPESAIVDVKKIWEDLLQQSGGIKSISKNLTKDGRTILCEWHNTPLRDKAGKVIGAASLVLDITEENEARQALLDKEQEQHEILDSMIDAVISIDEAGNVISFNKMAETLFGYKHEEIIGEKINLLMPKYHASHHDSYIQNYLDTGNAQVIGFAREVEGQHKDKTIFPMRLSIAELPLDDKGKRRFIGSCQDLSHVKEQEELLRRSQKMDALGKLTGGIAHDYNNMLGVVLGYAELLESMLTDQPKLAKYASQIHKAGERGAKLTKRLLSFSRHDAPTVANEVDINALLQEQQDMLQKTLTARIKLEFHLTDNLWHISLDQSEFEDAILNMSINAMHAMIDGGDLIITTDNQTLTGVDAFMLGLVPGDYVQLSISDTGSGMDSVTKNKLFDPFYSTKGNRGTGLGLSQVFGFVKRAEGIIKVHSRLGKGSKFILYFPRYDIETKTLSQVSITESIEYCGQESILIVDDEMFLLDLLSELLKPNGYTIFRAENGNQALEILEKESIDLMLSDVIMPEMDGYQLSAIVQDKYPAVKIQLATGYNDDRQKGKFDKSLYKNILFKPYNKKVLLKRIRNLLDDELTQPINKANKTLSSTIEWSNKLSVNIEEIDNDHKELLSLLNRCISHVSEAKKENNEVGVILHDLLNYTRYHFQREEHIMKIVDFPDIENHIYVHKELFKEVKHREEQFEQGDEISEQLIQFLSDWLITHILGMDKKLADYCVGKEKLITEALSK